MTFALTYRARDASIINANQSQRSHKRSCRKPIEGVHPPKEQNPGASTSRFLPQGSEVESSFSHFAIAALDLGGIEANLLEFLKLSRASGKSGVILDDISWYSR